jgi:hypothetical protein
MMVRPAQYFRLDDGHVALESAFAHHLRLMRSKIGVSADSPGDYLSRHGGRVLSVRKAIS